MDKSDKIGQIFFPAAFIHDSEENYHLLENLISEKNIGGLTFFHSRISAAANFEKRAEQLDVAGTFEQFIYLINRYQKSAQSPLIISIDGEYGLAMRIEQTPQYPFAITLGAMKSNSKKWAEEVGYRMGLDMKKAGVHLNLAPCADVNTNSDNPVIGYRSFGSDTAQVSQLALASYKGMKKAGIGACMKHFPGHGDTHVDSHLGLPVLTKTKAELEVEELVPFQFGIDHGIEMIMVGHLAVPALTGGKEIAASISYELITDLLKGEMGFKGLVISDALNMNAVAKLFPITGQLEWEAFRAGNDILCFSDHVSEGIQWISDRISDDQATIAFEKIQELKRKLGVLDFQKLEVPQFDWAEHSSLQSMLAEEYIKVLNGKIDPKSLAELAENGQLAHQVFFANEETAFEKALDRKWDTCLREYAVESAQKLIISVFVPSHKPLNQFGMDDNSLTEIKELAKNKACILVHFGNPLALKHLGNLSDYEAVICAYQGFDEVQKIISDLLS